MRDLEPKSDEALSRMVDHDGSFLSFWREQRGLTQDQLAEASGIDASRINTLENDLDAVASAEAVALAKALRVAPDDIVMPSDMVGDTIPPDDDKNAI